MTGSRGAAKLEAAAQVSVGLIGILGRWVAARARWRRGKWPDPRSPSTCALGRPSGGHLDLPRRGRAPSDPSTSDAPGRERLHATRRASNQTALAIGRCPAHDNGLPRNAGLNRVTARRSSPHGRLRRDFEMVTRTSSGRNRHRQRESGFEGLRLVLIKET